MMVVVHHAKDVLGDDGRQALLKQLRQDVVGFGARTPREVRSRERFLVELDRLANPLDRQGGPVHVTGSGLVLGPRGTVLHLHRRLGLWIQPGGHLEPGEAPWEAALRETREETGLPVFYPDDSPRLLHLDAHPAGEHFHLDLRYLMACDDVEPSPPPGESQQVRWFSLAEAMSAADEAVLDGLRRLADLQP
jgi:8-oxo-dGTP pyrophosphatase MutT (NUDIX family)